jgi:hypothetical protein
VKLGIFQLDEVTEIARFVGPGACTAADFRVPSNFAFNAGTTYAKYPKEPWVIKTVGNKNLGKKILGNKEGMPCQRPLRWSPRIRAD